MIQRPFLKWAGGKAKQAERIRAALPPARVLVEPFVGAGSVFMNTEYEHYVLNDINPDLINSFRQLQANPDKFIDAARALFTKENNDPAAFVSLRTEFNATADLFRKAVLFLYLNRHCFNGLCRYNGNGEFNVAFGKYDAPMFPEAELCAFAGKLARAELRCQSFEEVFLNLPGDSVVYCDPPYIPLTSTASFTDYSKDGFTFIQQQLLAALAEHCAVPVLVNNHNTPDTRRLYAAAQVQTFEVRRSISQKGSTRGHAKELLATFTGNGKACEDTLLELIRQHKDRMNRPGQAARQKKPRAVKEEQIDMFGEAQ